MLEHNYLTHCLKNMEEYLQLLTRLVNRILRLKVGRQLSSRLIHVTLLLEVSLHYLHLAEICSVPSGESF